MSERDLPRPGPDVVDDGIPATEEVRDEVLQTGAPGGVGGMPMGEEPWGSRQWGTTEREQREGEPLGARLDREEPDEEPTASGGVRLYEAGAEAGLADAEADAVGEVEPLSYDTLTAEESAMAVRDDPGGLTYDDDPGYVPESDEP